MNGSFMVPPEVFQKLHFMAMARGYRRAQDLARDILTEYVGAAPKPVSEDRPKFTPNEGLVLKALSGGPKSVSAIAREIGKLHANIMPLVRVMVQRAWAVEVAHDKFTGGRPAQVFRITELGLLKLEEERVRREKAEQYAEAGLQRHREESARKDPDPPKAPRPDRLRASAPDTDEGRYVTALLDSWYAAQPSASLKDTQQILMAYSAQAHDQIKLGKDWAEVTEMAKTRVWGTLDDELEAADVLDEARFMAGM